MKRTRILSFLLIFALTFGLAGNFAYAEEVESSDLSASEKIAFTVNVNKNISKKIKFELNGKAYKMGSTVKLEKGKTHKLVFKDIPNGYAFNEISKIGFKFFAGGKVVYDETTKTSTQEYDFEISDDASVAKISFYVMQNNYKVFMNSPVIGESEFIAYGKPNTKAAVMRGFEEVTTGEFDAKGEYVVKLKSEIEDSTPFTITSKDEDGIGIGFKIPVSKLGDLKVTIEENKVKIGGKRVTGTLESGEDIISTLLSDRLTANVYRYKDNEFEEIDNITVNEDKTTFKLVLPKSLKSGDVVYVTYGSLFNEVNTAYVIPGTPADREEKEEIEETEEEKEEEKEEILEIKNEVLRLSGANRFKTALNIAEEVYPEAENIVIANGLVSADALAAGPLANELKAPILLSDKDTVEKELSEYITSTGSKNVYVVGGTGSISKKFVDDLKRTTGVNAERISGKNRFETSLEVAKILIKDHGYNEEVVLANGIIDADALASSTYATENKRPIILTDSKKLNSNVATGLKELKVEYADIIGGENSISKRVVNGTDIKLGERISGNDRYETSLKIAEKSKNIRTIVVANGYKSVDALASGPLAYSRDGAILLTDGSKLTSGQSSFIEGLDNLNAIYVAGGNSSVDSVLYKTLEELFEEYKVVVKEEDKEEEETESKTESVDDVEDELVEE